LLPWFGNFLFLFPFYSFSKKVKLTAPMKVLKTYAKKKISLSYYSSWNQIS
jgi:hypothetical protein